METRRTILEIREAAIRKAKESGRSTPSFTEFNPLVIPSQARLVRALAKVDYSEGVHEFLLSGTVGSSKSMIAAHLAVRHCLMNQRARLMLGRRSLPDLKDTIFQKIIEHLEDSGLEDRKDYWVNWSTAKVWFRNGSEIISRSWADKKFKKFRSLELSAVVFEELTENDDKDKQAYFETKARVGRLSHIKERWIICCTNPDGPRHWAYQYFIHEKSPTRHVLYSKAVDNPFLPENYIEQLRKDFDPKQARRMLDGEWIEIDEERIYYSYNSDIQFLRKPYKMKPAPISLNFDFNIGVGKPMSSAAMQYVDGQFHIFDQVVIQGARTLSIMEEWRDKGIFEPFEYETIENGQVVVRRMHPQILLHGDASGKSQDTRSVLSDWDLITKFLAQHNVQFKLEVPLANPPIRTRHNRVNAFCENDLGQRRLWVYEKAKTVDEGLRLTALAKGAEYQEDDSKQYQHITTAIGYGIVWETTRLQVVPPSQRR